MNQYFWIWMFLISICKLDVFDANIWNFSLPVTSEFKYLKSNVRNSIPAISISICYSDFKWSNLWKQQIKIELKSAREIAALRRKNWMEISSETRTDLIWFVNQHGKRCSRGRTDVSLEQWIPSVAKTIKGQRCVRVCRGSVT